MVIHRFPSKGKKINGEYYANYLDRFIKDLKRTRPHMAKDEVIFHQDNARVQSHWQNFMY